MFENQQSSQNSNLKPVGPISHEVEDILDAVEPVAGGPSPKPQGFSPSRAYTKNAPPPLNLDKVSSPTTARPQALRPSVPPAQMRPASPQIPRPQPGATSPEDMFSGSDTTTPKIAFPQGSRAQAVSVLPQGLEIKKPQGLPDIQGESEKKQSGSKAKVLIIVLLVVLLTSGLAVAAYYAYQQFNIPKTQDEPLDTNTEIPDVNNLADPNNTVPIANPTPNPTQTPEENLDSDADGISDKEEANYGTNINLADSDNDGLTDRDEVKTYLTDPLNPDTDSDGYTDGNEISNRYNPKGPGKLFEGQ